jgi:ribosomal RNA-processing protein 17
MKEVGGTPGPAGKSGGKKKNKKNKTEIVFDEAKRVDFLTGFRRRKEERRKKAKDEYEKTAKEEMRLAK